MARLYANENFPLPVVQTLRGLGHDVLTHNRRHFIRLHADQPIHCGIVVCTFDPDFSRQSRHIDEAISTHDSLDGKLIRVNRPL